MSRYSVIFCAFFARAKNGGCSRKCRGHQTWKLGRPRGLAVWPPCYAYAGCMLTSQCREPTTSRARAALLHLSTATGSTFIFRLQGPSKVISPSSKFEISSDSYIDNSISILYSHVWFCAPSEACFGDLVSDESMGDWEKEWAVWS